MASNRGVRQVNDVYLLPGVVASFQGFFSQLPGLDSWTAAVWVWQSVMELRFFFLIPYSFFRSSVQWKGLYFLGVIKETWKRGILENTFKLEVVVADYRQRDYSVDWSLVLPNYHMSFRNPSYRLLKNNCIFDHLSLNLFQVGTGSILTTAVMVMRLKCSATLLQADKPVSTLIKTRKRCVQLLCSFLLRTWMLRCANSWGRGSSVGLYVLFHKPRQPFNQRYIGNKIVCFPAVRGLLSIGLFSFS